MLISVVTETFWPEINGVAMTLHRLVTGLIARGHRVQLVCPHLSDRPVVELPAEVSYHPVRGCPLPGYKDVNIGFPSKKYLKNLWLSARPDVIYVATEGPLGWSAAQEANRQDIPVTSGFHTNFHSYSRHYRLGYLEKIARRYLTAMHNKTVTTIVPTVEQKHMLQAMGIQHVSIMGRGVDTGLFSPAKRSLALRKQWGVSAGDPVVLYVGRTAEEKNLGLTIQTYYQLRQLNNRIKFVLVGDGPLLKKLKKEHPSFIFAGSRTGEDLAAHYASADIFLFSSLTETFGNVILEAMASGLGVVAFDYAAAHMHISPNENGVLVKTDEELEFIHKAKFLLQNELLLKKIRTNADKYAKKQSWQEIVEQFENILVNYYANDQVDWKQKLESVS
ncbi:MAG: glycosyltransferase family 1 protein [Gammaproteobacteria bacterium]|jgi:glycosyltransferase involved in cell wall biosynthesis